MVDAVALVLNFANVIGYVKCQRDSQPTGSGLSSVVTDSLFRKVPGLF